MKKYLMVANMLAVIALLSGTGAGWAFGVIVVLASSIYAHQSSKQTVG
ncbi:TPA: hypothetical protein ACMDS2_004242 [Vibrio parahaemolyticus]|nr:hypothetical protein [Vibrio parahaemolyticus]